MQCVKRIPLTLRYLLSILRNEKSRIATYSKHILTRSVSSGELDIGKISAVNKPWTGSKSEELYLYRVRTSESIRDQVGEIGR